MKDNHISKLMILPVDVHEPFFWLPFLKSTILSMSNKLNFGFNSYPRKRVFDSVFTFLLRDVMSLRLFIFLLLNSHTNQLQLSVWTHLACSCVSSTDTCRPLPLHPSSRLHHDHLKEAALVWPSTRLKRTKTPTIIMPIMSCLIQMSTTFPKLNGQVEVTSSLDVIFKMSPTKLS